MKTEQYAMWWQGMSELGMGRRRIQWAVCLGHRLFKKMFVFQANVGRMVEALCELLLLGLCWHALPHKGAYTPLRGLSKLLLYTSNR
jgi:hypothetical protein